MALAVFIFGTIVGSFLNVVIARYNTGDSPLRGRSRCFSCNKKLSWHELLPLVSFGIQRGRCRGCGSKISWQYPIVEALTALVFLEIFQLDLSFASVAFSWIVFSILIAIAVYDAYHKIIPDGLVFAFIALAGASAVLRALHGHDGFSSVLTGVGLFLFLAALWYFSSGRAMGFGDAKLALGIGWFLSPHLAVNAVILAFWIGAAVGIGFLFARPKRVTLRSEIPFGPFLILGTLLVFLFHITVI